MRHPAESVDGFHLVNAGPLAIGRPRLVPCTPRGVMHLLAEARVALPGARVKVIGRSAIVGRLHSQLLIGADATVRVLHSGTRDLPAECRRAEVLVAAAGCAELVRGDRLSEGAVLIDVGITRLADGRLVGGVAFAEAAARTAASTPVPGGVGPMTIACLLENTLDTALIQHRPS